MPIRIEPAASAWPLLVALTKRLSRRRRARDRLFAVGGCIPRGKLLRPRIGVEGVFETVGIPGAGRNERW